MVSRRELILPAPLVSPRIKQGTGSYPLPLENSAATEKQTPQLFSRRKVLRSLVYGALWGTYQWLTSPKALIPLDLSYVIKKNLLESGTLPGSPSPEQLPIKDKDLVATLESRFQLPVSIEFGDHILGQYDDKTIVMGELNQGSLLMEAVGPDCPVDSVWLQGIEYLSCDRQTLMLNNLGLPSALFALDFDPAAITDSYRNQISQHGPVSEWKARMVLNNAANTYEQRQLWTRRIFMGGGGLGWLLDSSLNDRSSPLAHGMAGAALGVLHTLTDAMQFQAYLHAIDYDTIQHQAHNIPDSPTHQLYDHALPWNSFIHLRDLVMTANTNSLTQFDLSPYGDKIAIFAGNGHSGMRRLLVQEPETIANWLSQMFVQMFNQAAGVYNHADTAAQRSEIIDFTSNTLALVTKPIFYRDNQHTSTAQHTLSTKPEKPVIKSSYLILLETLAELLQQSIMTQTVREFYELVTKAIISRYPTAPPSANTTPTNPDYLLKILTPDQKQTTPDGHASSLQLLDWTVQIDHGQVVEIQLR